MHLLKWDGTEEVGLLSTLQWDLLLYEDTGEQAAIEVTSYHAKCVSQSVAAVP
jgi:hypothetical protein